MTINTGQLYFFYLLGYAATGIFILKECPSVRHRYIAYFAALFTVCIFWPVVWLIAALMALRRNA